jgi:superfamily II DNA or RNA helicase
MKCLDEGVDVPSTKTAIIMASSGNPREFIQRRGRVLRKFTGKEKAIIHDFIVVPTLKGNIDPKTLELERKILIKEVRRFKEFAKSSLNSLEALNEIYPMLNKYNISLDVSE